MRAHFTAKFLVRSTANGGPIAGGFKFPESGVRVVPTRHDETNDRATVAITYCPNTVVSNGEEFVAGCRVLVEEYWVPKLKVGNKFSVWDGRDIVDAVIQEVHV